MVIHCGLYYCLPGLCNRKKLKSLELIKEFIKDTISKVQRKTPV